jgi:hypothetical protein
VADARGNERTCQRVGRDEFTTVIQTIAILENIALSGEAAVVRGIIPWLTATAKTRTKESVTLERKATEIQLVAAQEKITNPPRNFHAVAIR